MKIVREHYLRDDIPCGLTACMQCNKSRANLDKNVTSESAVFPRPHFILPDTNVVLHQVTTNNIDMFLFVVEYAYSMII